MKVLFPWVALLILALTAVACATAAPTATPLPGADPSNCARFPDEADRQGEHDAIQWQLCPVIKNGYLRVAGTTTGTYRVHGGGQNFPTFVIQYRNTDNPYYVIRRPVPKGYNPPVYTGYVLTESGDVVIGRVTPSTYAGIPAYKGSSRGGVATDWEVRPQFFSIEARVGTPDEPVDLWVWGSDAPQAYADTSRSWRQRGLRGLVLPARSGDFNAKPLAIRSIGYLEPDATPVPPLQHPPDRPTSAPPQRPTRLPTITPWPPTPTTPPFPTFTPEVKPTPIPTPTPTAVLGVAGPWITLNPRSYFSIQLPSTEWKEVLDEYDGGRYGVSVSRVGYQYPSRNPRVDVLVLSRFGLPRDTTANDLLELDLALLRRFYESREVSTTEVDPGILRTHFQLRGRELCSSQSSSGQSDVFGLHIMAEPRSHTVLVGICDFVRPWYDDDFVDRMFDGFSYKQ